MIAAQEAELWKTESCWNKLGKDSSKTYPMFELEEGQQSTKARGIITLEGST